MTPMQAVFLGMVQGFTEFLPVSSSGHLLIWERLVGAPPGGLTFNIALHCGSLFAVVAVFWSDWVRMARSIMPGKHPVDGAARALMFQLIVATIPIAIAGLFMRDYVERAFGSPFVLGAMLLLTGALLWRAEAMAGGQRLERMTMAQAWRIGVGQALALLPGLSRSGTTLAFGMFAGLERKAAARFAFLLAVPAILGASLVQGISVFSQKEAMRIPFDILFLGMVTSTVASYAAMRLVFSFLKPGRFIWFARYVLLLGAAVLVAAFSSAKF